MPTLYNCKHDGDIYRITKFNSDFNVEASYLCNHTACECPAGHRPTCRHRQMLPKFIARDAVGTNWFFDHDRGGWVQGWKEEPTIQKEALEDETEYDGDIPGTEESLAPAGLGQASDASPRFNMDYSNSVGQSPAADALQPSPSSPLPSPIIRRRV